MAAATTQEEQEFLKEKVLELAQTVDLETTGLKQFITFLSQHIDNSDDNNNNSNINLKSHKAYIKECLLEAIREKQEQQDDNDDGDNDDNDDDDDDDDDVPLPTPTKKRGGGGLSAQKPISRPLAQFFGHGDDDSAGEISMARTEIVKQLWVYIRHHNLQNPNNKQQIICDAALKQVFGCDQMTMFTMNKYVSAHIHPFKPVDLTSTPSSSSKKRKTRTSGGDSGSKKKVPRKQQEYWLSPALQAVVHTDRLSRPQVVSKIWEYIRTNSLQNPSDKREILCDPTLAQVMSGKKKVTMFSMNQHLTPHLLERVNTTDGAEAAAPAKASAKKKKQQEEEEDEDEGSEYDE